MRNRLVFLSALVVTMLALTPVMRGQDTAQHASVPDISGVWLIANPQFGLFPKGDAPLQPWAQAKFKANPQTNDPTLACLPAGVPRLMFVLTPMEILQLPTRVVIIHEAWDPPRQIYLNREHPKDLDPTYSGDAIGKWEGDTLVVDTIGFKDTTWVDGVGLPHSEAMHVVERIRRADHNTLVDDFTIEDPRAFTKPIATQKVYKLKPSWEIQEYICEENNKYTSQGK